MGKDNLTTEDINVKEKNKRANLLGVDLFITEPLLEQLCIGGHYLLVEKYIECCSFDKDIINREFLKACHKGHLEVTKYLIKQGEN